ncbi:hypothetical protein JTE90_025107 [Oedothorax gibbosus]|uniref:Uncharacterized protein n=1 Tax=Oedothorax gibbosus TaxID=931172 RepID=A0AAV6U2M6_9ARAC|nr:hypothetical protein JTE90_025107 [Oedothorax gibbosus]
MVYQTVPNKPKLKHTDTSYFLDNVVATWKPRSETWHFRWGGDIGAFMGSLSALYIMYNLRRELKLRQYARLTCYLPVIGMAGFLTETMYDVFITPQILTGRKCPLCISTKAAALQIGLGVVYPLVLSPLIGFYLADRLLTYPVPSLSRAPGEMLKLWAKLVLKSPRPLIASAVLQGAVMAYITNEQQLFVINYVSSKNKEN